MKIIVPPPPVYCIASKAETFVDHFFCCLKENEQHAVLADSVHFVLFFILHYPTPLISGVISALYKWAQQFICLGEYKVLNHLIKGLNIFDSA